MTIYNAKEAAEKGVTLTIGDTVVVSETRQFTIEGVTAFVSPLNGKASVNFQVSYIDGEKTGTDSVYSDHLHTLFKPA